MWVFSALLKDSRVWHNFNDIGNSFQSFGATTLKLLSVPLTKRDLGTLSKNLLLDLRLQLGWYKFSISRM